MVLPDPVRRSLLACLAVFLCGAVPARAASTAWIGDDRAAVGLVTAPDAVSPGPSVEAALEFRFGDGWHGAWRSPGVAGLAPTFDGGGSEGGVLDSFAGFTTVLAEVAGIPRAMGLAGILALLLSWLALGRRTRVPDRRRGLVTAALVLTLVPVTVWPRGFGPSRGARTEGGPWRAFAPEAIPVLVAEGKVVVVDVTASWCLICRLNDVTTLDRAENRARLSAPDTVAMRADWTQADPAILAFLRRFGRFGIPLVAVYGPGLPRGEALPELLTPATMRAAIVRAERENAHKITTEFSP